jgi:hypothetical protein
MKRILLAAAAVVAVLAVLAISRGANAQAPGPSAGRTLAGGLLNPKGLAIGPDGMIYVAEGGTGGAGRVTLDGNESTFGDTGRISKIDPATGTRTTVIDGLPSNGSLDSPEAIGPTDVGFIGSTLYYLQTHGGEAYGFPDQPTGIYRITTGGDAQLVADIGQFNIDNPVADIVTGGQEDIEVGGNPYSMIVRDNVFYVTDGNQNQVMRVTASGDITRVAELPGHPVTTGITFSPAGGPFYVTNFGAFPFTADKGTVYTVSPGGTVTKIAGGTGGMSMMIDAGFGPGNQLYSLQFADEATDPNGPPFAFFTGKVLKVNSNGTYSPVITGLMIPTAMLFDGDTLYITNAGVGTDGEIIVVENFSSVQPPAANPTPTAGAGSPVATATRSGIVAPDTGTGDSAGGGSGTLFVVLALAAGAALCVGGATVARKRA